MLSDNLPQQVFSQEHFIIIFVICLSEHVSPRRKGRVEICEPISGNPLKGSQEW